LTPSHFAKDAADDVIGQIARFAVEHQMNTVLSPGHYLREGTKSEWFKVDCEACTALRDALDREGGREIGIDYELLLPHVALDDVDERGQIVEKLKDLPFDNLWLRASGFGSDAPHSLRGATSTRYRLCTTWVNQLLQTTLAV
jgi:hypothetical protein